MATPVPSVITARTNGPLIAAAAALWIKPTDVLMDVTFGRGRWHTDYRHPGPLITHDIAIDGVDFRDLPEPDGSVDCVLYDPPYISPGGRKTSTVPDFNDRYGLVDVPRTPADTQALIAAGMAEAVRVLSPGGRLMVKCGDYISSGKFVTGRHHVVSTAVELGLEQWDEIVHASGTGPQPTVNLDGSPRRQVHSRRGHSFLCIFGKPSTALLPGEQHLRLTFGMTLDAYTQILNSQGGRCAVCRTTEPGGRAGIFHVDHDHRCCPGKRSCGLCIRGLLCATCNLGIGALGDEASRLHAALDYLAQGAVELDVLDTRLKAHSGGSSPRTLTAEEIEFVRTSYLEMRPVHWIAKELRTNHRTVDACREALGIPRRGMSA